MALNKRKQEFIKHYLATGNGKESVIKAGYTCKHPDKYANYLINTKEVKEQLEKLQEEFTRELGVTTSWIVDNIKNIAENGKNDSDKLRALELLGKWKRMFQDSLTQIAVLGDDAVKQVLDRTSKAQQCIDI